LFERVTDVSEPATATLPHVSAVLTFDVHVPPLPTATVPPEQSSDELVKVSRERAPAFTVITALPEGDAPSLATRVTVSALKNVAFSEVVLTPDANETLVAGYVGAVPLGALPAPDQAIA
jgi:hypothetical protein